MIIANRITIPSGGSVPGSASPSQVAGGPVVWYQGDTGSVSSWTDLSNLGHHALQVTPANQPSIISSAINGHSAFRFAGGVTQMKATAFTLNQPETLFLVAKMIAYGSGGVNDIAWDGDTAGSMTGGSIISGTTAVSAGAGMSAAVSYANGTYDYLTAQYNSSSSFTRIHGTQVASGNTGTNAAAGFTIGGLGNATRGANVEIAEVLVYASALSALAIAQVEAYLKQRYAL